MGFGISLILIAVGAILTWAVHPQHPGSVDVNTVGVILMITGGIGFLLSLAFWSTWWGPGYFRRTYAAPTSNRVRVRRVRAAAPAAPADDVVEEEEEVY